ncbi:MAG: nicotinamide-nucleotide adenylyltransferase [Haloarculaceae archaeon]
MTRGFFIGRFQPFHDGHRAVVEHAAGEVDELVLGIGSADVSHTVHDPFTAGERVLMVRKAVADVDVPVYVVPIEDIDRNALWVSHIESMAPSFEVAYSNNPLVARLFEEAGTEVRHPPMFDRDRFEGTGIRRQMLAGDAWTDHVPEAVVDVIEEVDGIERIRTVAEDDSEPQSAS